MITLKLEGRVMLENTKTAAVNQALFVLSKYLKFNGFVYFVFFCVSRDSDSQWIK